MRIWERLVARPSKEPVREPITSKEPVREPKPSEPVRESKPSKELDESRSRMRESFEHLGSADYLRGKSGNPPAADAGFGHDDTASAQRASRPKHSLALLRRLPPPIWRVLAVVGLAAVALERVAELIVSKRNRAWSLARGGTEFGVGHYPVMVVLHTGLLAASPRLPKLGTKLTGVSRLSPSASHAKPSRVSLARRRTAAARVTGFPRRKLEVTPPNG